MRRIGPSLRLHAYVLSATPPDGIGDEERPRKEWEERDVYSLEDSDWPRRVIEDVLGPVS